MLFVSDVICRKISELRVLIRDWYSETLSSSINSFKSQAKSIYSLSSEKLVLKANTLSSEKLPV